MAKLKNKENISKKYFMLRKKEEWCEAKLGDVAKVIGGGTPNTSVPEYWGGEIPWITPRDLSNYSNRYISNGERNISQSGLLNSSAKLIPKGAVLLTTRAPVGYLAIANKQVSTNQGFRSLIPNSEVDGLFLFYLLKNSVEYLQSYAEGSTFGELSGSTLKSIYFLFPPLPEQKAIAEVLSSLDDKIDLLHLQNKTLETIAQTLFRQWFIEEVQDDWEKGKLGDIATVKSGYAFKGMDFLESGNCKVIKIKNLKGDGRIDINDTVYINNSIAQNKKVLRFKLIEGDIVFAMSGNTTGKIGIIPFSNKSLYLNQRVGKFFIKDNYNLFIRFFLSNGNYEEKILQMGYGSAQPNVSPSQIEGIKCLLPNIDILEKFNRAITPVVKRIKINTRQIPALANLRNVLLPKLMSGKVRVKIQ